MENITLVVVKPSKPKSKPPKASKMEEQPLSKTSATQPLKALDSETTAEKTFVKNSQPSSSLSRKLLSAGTAACIADVITFPLDMAKVRLQIQGEAIGARRIYNGIFGTLYTVAKTEGIRGWYGGITAGLQRQMCFASVRIGLYDSMKQTYMNWFQVSNSSSSGLSILGVRILAGITTGGMAVLAAQPTDVVKVRMQAQGASKSRYTNVRQAYASIARNEGVRGLWKGTIPNVTRNSIVNVTELVSYDLIKENLLARRLLADAMPCHVVSAFGAGLVTTIIASPVDVVKTRFMNSSAGTYSGALNCATTMLRKEGFTAFYKGFMPSFMRLGSWNVVMFVTYEQIKRVVLNSKESEGVFVTHYVHSAASANANSNNNSFSHIYFTRAPRHFYRQF